MSAFLKNKIIDIEKKFNNLQIPDNNNDNEELKKNNIELNINLKKNDDKLSLLENEFNTFKNKTYDNIKNITSNLQTLSNNVNIIDKNLNEINNKKFSETLTKITNDNKTSNDNFLKKTDAFEKNIKLLTENNSALNKKIQSIEHKLSSYDK